LESNKNIKLIGIDLGGTKVNVGLIQGDQIIDKQYAKIPGSTDNEWDVINLIIDLTKKILSNHKIEAIGIGVPSILNRNKGIIYEVHNIPSWKKVPLGDILKEEFGIPVFLDNDANCFVLGEYHFGKGKGCANLVGITLGTGMGTGIITNNQLMGDANGGSGEFGMMPYKNGVIEDYSSGKFFKNIVKTDGEDIFQNALNGDKKALDAYAQYGHYLGHAIKTILYALDPEKIIIGGSIAQSSQFFDQGLKESLKDFAFKKTIDKIEIIYSDTPDIALLGSAALFYRAHS
jgi:glucokinase